MASSYLSVLLRGNWGQKWNWGPDDFNVSEVPVENFDVTAMKEKVRAMGRDTRGSDGSYTLDGCLKVGFADRGHVPKTQRVANQMRFSLVAGVVGSLVLAGVKSWTQMAGRFPKLVVVTQILLGVGAVLSACRYQQIQQYLNQIPERLQAYGKEILTDRYDVYSQVGYLLELCLPQCHTPSLHSFEAKVLWQGRVAAWAKELLNKNISAPGSFVRRTDIGWWLANFCKVESPLYKIQAKLLFNRSVNSTDVPHEWRSIFFDYKELCHKCTREDDKELGYAKCRDFLDQILQWKEGTLKTVPKADLKW